jgi:hypothetical protein
MKRREEKNGTKKNVCIFCAHRKRNNEKKAGEKKRKFLFETTFIFSFSWIYFLHNIKLDISFFKFLLFNLPLLIDATRTRRSALFCLFHVL